MAAATEEAPIDQPAADPAEIARLAWRWAVIVAIAVGVGLRAWQYFAQASLVLDEAAVARNVLDRSVLGLLTPLDYAQVAPPGFLLLVKLATALFGPAEWALRLTPFIFGLAALLLFPLVARRFLPRPAAVAATFMFAAAVPAIFYSAELKQYSGDVAAALAVLWAVSRLLDAAPVTRRLMIALWVFGFVALLFSDAVAFMLAASGAVLVADAFLRGRPDRGNRIGLASGWAVEVLAAVAWGHHSMTPADRAYMHVFWAALFVPHRLAAVGPWLTTVARGTFSGRQPGSIESLHYPFVVFSVLFLTGVVTLFRADLTKGALIAGPVALVLAAAAADLYPFMTRVGLFMVPLYLIAVAHGTDTVSRACLGKRAGGFGCLLLVPLSTAALLTRLPPFLSEHVRPVLQYLEAHRQPGDAIWVYYAGGQGFEYYEHVFPIAGDVQIGDCDRQNPRGYLHQVDLERGRARVWFVFSHFGGNFHFDERGLILGYLDAIGRKLDEFHAPPEDRSEQVAAVYLYDLADPGTLAHSSATVFPIAGKFTPARWSCYGVASPIPSGNGAAAAVMRKAAQGS